MSFAHQYTHNTEREITTWRNSNSLLNHRSLNPPILLVAFGRELKVEIRGQTGGAGTVSVLNFILVSLAYPHLTVVWWKRLNVFFTIELLSLSLFLIFYRFSRLSRWNKECELLAIFQNIFSASLRFHFWFSQDIFCISSVTKYAANVLSQSPVKEKYKILFLSHYFKITNGNYVTAL